MLRSMQITCYDARVINSTEAQMSDDEMPNKELRILNVMRSILIDVIKDTTTEPGLKHPLTDTTIDNIRHGLDLITARQRELDEGEGEGRNWDLRPSYPPEPQAQTKDGVVVSISSVKKRNPPKDPGKE